MPLPELPRRPWNVAGLHGGRRRADATRRPRDGRDEARGVVLVEARPVHAEEVDGPPETPLDVSVDAAQGHGDQPPGELGQELLEAEPLGERVLRAPTGPSIDEERDEQQGLGDGHRAEEVPLVAGGERTVAQALRLESVEARCRPDHGEQGQQKPATKNPHGTRARLPAPHYTATYNTPAERGAREVAALTS